MFQWIQHQVANIVLGQPWEPPLLPVLSPRSDHQPELVPAARDASDATAGSLFFERLPADVRRMILIEAFGDRSMHAQLQMVNPLWRGYIPLELGSTEAQQLPEMVPGSKWQWFGRACNRGQAPWRRKSRDLRVGALGWLQTCRQA